VVDYDPAWPVQFCQIRDKVWPVVSDVAVGVEHVGSTSVPGLAAKPVIDLDIVIPSRNELPLARAGLGRLGYEYQGDLGIEERYAFRAPPGERPHNLYVCCRQSVSLFNHIALRDHLRTHPSDVASYSALKRRLAEQFPQDIGRYIEGKSEFILSILARYGLSADRSDAIRRANQTT